MRMPMSMESEGMFSPEEEAKSKASRQQKTTESKDELEGKVLSPKSVVELEQQLWIARDELERYLSEPEFFENSGLISKFKPGDLEDLAVAIDQLISYNLMRLADTNRPGARLYQYSKDVGLFFGPEALPDEGLALRLRGMAADHPELSTLYTEVLREYQKNTTKWMENMLDSEIAALPKPDPELLREMDEKTFSLHERSEGRDRLLKELFPSGNYLLHSTDLINTMDILQSGALMTSAEIEQIRRVPWGHGGHDGISFNMNDIRVMTGHEQHFIGFMASPEAVLGDRNMLEVPGNSAAKFEVQLKEQPDKIDKNFLGMRRSFPRIDLKDTIIMVNAGDADKIKQILAAEGIAVKAILTYSPSTLRIPSWLVPMGDHEAATKLIRKNFDEAGLKPSIDWSNDLFPEPPKIHSDTMVDAASAARARVIVMTEKGLEVVEPKKKVG